MATILARPQCDSGFNEAFHMYRSKPKLRNTVMAYLVLAVEKLDVYWEHSGENWPCMGHLYILQSVMFQNCFNKRYEFINGSQGTAAQNPWNAGARHVHGELFHHHETAAKLLHDEHHNTYSSSSVSVGLYVLRSGGLWWETFTVNYDTAVVFGISSHSLWEHTPSFWKPALSRWVELIGESICEPYSYWSHYKQRIT